MGSRSKISVQDLRVSAYVIPTESPESDGTLSWNRTVLVLVTTKAGGQQGIGYTYADESTAALIHHTLANRVIGQNALDIPAIWASLRHHIRNLGRPGIASMAIAAIDNSLWDLKAKLLCVPLVMLLGRVREGVPVYGSGAFTSYSIDRLQKQLGEWARRGIRMVKMKVGTHPEQDVDRVRAAREAIGRDVELFVDANGAYTRKQALEKAEQFADFDVIWFEEPVSSDDLEGLRLLQDRAPAGMAIAAGEYGYDLPYFQRMLDAQAVDVLQADATRCSGISEFLRVGALAEAFSIPLSAHTAPAIHLHACCSLNNLQHIEYFYDHVRIERMLFDGAVEPVNGVLYPDLSRLGIGLALKERDARKFAA
jgi:L-alanine-DL-glutamate epimerase-like enolase superfamily enzyme